MISLCGQLIMFDNGSFQSKRVAFLVITLCGLSAPSLAFIATYSSFSSGICFAAVLIVLFCSATYFVFPKSVSWHSLISVDYLQTTNIVSFLLFYFSTFGLLCPSSLQNYQISTLGLH